MITAGLFDFMGVVGFTRMAVTGDSGGGPTRTVLDEDVVSLLQCLRIAGLKLALVSNNDRDTFAAQAPEAFATLEALFDLLVFSSDVGYEKPSRRIYQFALDRLGVEASACHYFDDLARNVDAAVALGMEGTVVTSSGDVSMVVEGLLTGR